MHSSIDYLVTGTSSGLGRYLRASLGGDAFVRESDAVCLSAPYKYLIHCGFGRPNDYASISEYIDSQLHQFHQLLPLYDSKFVFISSVEVLAKHSMDSNPYAYAKSIIESELSSMSSNVLILRPGLLFGPGMRPNQLLRICIEDSPHLSLAPSSSFGIVFYHQVLDCILSDTSGIINLASQPYVTLAEVASLFNNKPLWGSYIYQTPSLDHDCIPSSQSRNMLQSPLTQLKDFVVKKNYIWS